MNVRGIINETVNETVRKLKKAGLMKNGQKSTAEKMEEALFNYPTFKGIKGRRFCNHILLGQKFQRLLTVVELNAQKFHEKDRCDQREYCHDRQSALEAKTIDFSF